MPVALVETGFMSNPSDEAKLATDKYRRQIAESMLKGIIKYLEETKIAGHGDISSVCQR